MTQTSVSDHASHRPARTSVTLADGVALSMITMALDGPRRPVLLVHGLASNARLWDGVAAHLARAGHPVAAVDQRGHGRSSKPDTGYDFETLGSDLSEVLAALGWSDRRPMVAGQSWGGNVVLDLAAHRPGLVGGLTLVDGGTIELAARFAGWSGAEAALSPPRLAGIPAHEFEAMIRAEHPDWPDSGIAGTLANIEVLGDGTVRPWLSRENHLRILRHLWEQRPRALYPLVGAPVLLLVAEHRGDGHAMDWKRQEVAAALSELRDAEVRWIAGDHDLHAQYPERVAGLIHEATEKVDPAP